MNLLLDTHVFLWWDDANPKLGQDAARAIADPGNLVYVSAASVWELVLKRQTGRLVLSRSPGAAIERNGFLALPISAAHTERTGVLPPLHRDPFDRLLVAQAQLESLTLVTADAKVAAYPVAQLWAGAARR